MIERMTALVLGLLGTALAFCCGPLGWLIDASIWDDNEPATGVVGILAVVFFITALIGSVLAPYRQVWSGRIMAASGIAIVLLFDFTFPALASLFTLVGAALIIDRTIPHVIGLVIRYGIAMPIGAVVRAVRGSPAAASP